MKKCDVIFELSLSRIKVNMINRLNFLAGGGGVVPVVVFWQPFFVVQCLEATHVKTWDHTQLQQNYSCLYRLNPVLMVGKG